MMFLRSGLLLAVLAALHLVGLLFFVGGFLLTRYEVSARSSCSDWGGGAGPHVGCWLPRRFDTAVIIVIDALRYDFAAPDVPVDQQSAHFRGHMPAVAEALDKEPRNSRLYRFIADGPTTTMQRLKGLTTGSLPTFIDVSSNFNSAAAVG